MKIRLISFTVFMAFIMLSSSIMAERDLNTKVYEGLLRNDFGQDVRYYQPREDFQNVLHDDEALYRVKITNGDSFYVFFNSELKVIRLSPESVEGLDAINTFLVRLHPDLPTELSGFLEVTDLLVALFNFSSGEVGDLGIEHLLKSDERFDWALKPTISYYEFVRVFEHPRIIIQGNGSWEMSFLYYSDSGCLEKWSFFGYDGLLSVADFHRTTVYPSGSFRIPRLGGFTDERAGSGTEKNEDTGQP